MILVRVLETDGEVAVASDEWHYPGIVGELSTLCGWQDVRHEVFEGRRVTCRECSEIIRLLRAVKEEELV